MTNSFDIAKQPFWLEPTELPSHVAEWINGTYVVQRIRGKHWRSVNGRIWTIDRGPDSCHELKRAVIELVGGPRDGEVVA